MFGIEVAIESAPVVKRRRKGPRAELKPLEYEELFILLTLCAAIGTLNGLAWVAILLRRSAARMGAQ